MVISIPIPDFIVRAIAGKGSTILVCATTAGVMHGIGMLARYSPMLANMLGDPAVVADQVTIAICSLIAALGNEAHIQSGSPLGRVLTATADDADKHAAEDLASKGIAAPAIPVAGPFTVGVETAAPEMGVSGAAYSKV